MSKPANEENGEPKSLSGCLKDKFQEDKSQEGTGIIDEMEKKIKSHSPPKVVISVIGDSSVHTPNPWPMHRFKQALIHAIKTLRDPWIFCEGNTPTLNADRVSKTVSQALREYLQVPWQQMKEQPAACLYKIWKQREMFPAEDEKYFKNIVLQKSTNGSMIDIVKTLSKQYVQAFSSETAYRMVIPALMVVVEGDYDTIEEVQKAVDKNVPVVLVKGSGMAADLINYCLDQDEDVKDIPNLMQKIALLFGGKTEGWDNDKGKEVLQKIVNKQNLLMSFDVNEDTPETFAEKAKEIILTSWALQDNLTEIEQTDNSSKKQDPPAAKPKPSSPLAFNLFYQKMHDKKVNQEKILQVLVMEALIAGEHNLVQVLINSQELEKWSIDFSALYDQVPDNLKRILKLDTYNNWNERIGNTKTGPTSAKYAEEAEEEVEMHPEVQRLKQLLDDYNAYEIPTEEKSYKMTERLLLWAVQTNQVKMAEMLWKKAQYPILTALVASELLGKMSIEALEIKETALSTELKDHSEIFCQRAVDTGENLHKDHPNYAVEALTKKHYLWGIYQNPISFAMKYGKYTFVTSEVVQRRFHERWDGTYAKQSCIKQSCTKQSCTKLDFRFRGDTSSQTGSKSAVIKRHISVCCLIFKTCFCRTLRKTCLATRTWFTFYYLCFAFFLVCFSALILSYLKEEWHHWEILTYLWIFGDFFEKCKKVIIIFKNYQFRKNLCECICTWRCVWRFIWNLDLWNVLEIVGYVLMILAIVFKFNDWQYTLELFSITLYVMYIRFLQAFLVIRSIGITIIMLKEALKELLRFLAIALVFIIGTGVVYHANLYPNHHNLFSDSKFWYWSIWRIIYLPFWATFGDFKAELEGVGENGCSHNETVYRYDDDIERCPERGVMVPIISGTYIIIASLLLVNLLIAMFTFRFEEIKNNSEKLWRFHRSKVIDEFEDRYPSPLNLVSNLLSFGKWMYGKCKGQSEDEKTIEDIQEIIENRWEESDKYAIEVYQALKNKKDEKKHAKFEEPHNKTDDTEIDVNGALGRKNSEDTSVVHTNLKDRREKAIKQIKEYIKGVIEKKRRDDKTGSDTTIIENIAEEVEKQWNEYDDAFRKIDEWEDIKILLKDHLDNLKEEITKRWNREKDLENIQRTIAERWEKKGERYVLKYLVQTRTMPPKRRAARQHPYIRVPQSVPDSGNITTTSTDQTEVLPMSQQRLTELIQEAFQAGISHNASVTSPTPTVVTSSSEVTSTITSSSMTAPVSSTSNMHTTASSTSNMTTTASSTACSDSLQTSSTNTAFNASAFPGTRSVVSATAVAESKGSL